MNRLTTLFFLLFLLVGKPSAQVYTGSPVPPRLVVVISVDQMRNDYLERFGSYFGEGGFDRLKRQGIRFNNAKYHYVPTYTGPGHACISTGSFPMYHGIVANDWFNRKEQKSVYCVADPFAKTVGSNSTAGQMSPRNLWATTLGDELKLAYSESKNVAVAIKDRSAILMAGHYSDGVYWLDPANGHFISSSFYTMSLPDWVEKFNQSNQKDKELNRAWELDKKLIPFSHLDNRSEEASLPGEESPVFPHNNPKSSSQLGYQRLKYLPAGNTLTIDFALEMIRQEKLGLDDNPDLLNISFSQPDILGHQFGIRSLEVADTYIKLDQNIAKLFGYLDQNIGAEHWVVVLTSDHGAAENPKHAQSLKIPGGVISEQFKEELEHKVPGSSAYIEAVQNLNVYLSPDCPSDFQQKIREAMRELDGILDVYSLDNLYPLLTLNHGPGMLAKGLNPERSGNLIGLTKPGFMEGLGAAKGTTHGSAYAYDTHVPLLFYGSIFKPHFHYQEVGVEDIAPTLSQLLGIPAPNASVGAVLPIFKGK
jgi:predicted AlkP superfamily pyrophosphatase or phosphodiesterase